MSLHSVPLPKGVAEAWRKHLGTNHGQMGVDWLRRNSPTAAGDTPAALLEAALIWKGYQQALDDIEDRLTAIRQVPVSLEEAPLETPEMRA